jgi:hypothetical protein
MSRLPPSPLTAGAIVASIALVGCGGGGVAATSSPSPHRPTPLAHCVSELTFWTPKTLANDPSAQYGDYQDLGLTADEYAALKQTVLVTRQHRADAATPSSWSVATKTYVADRAKANCRVVTAPHPANTSSYGWPSG